MPEGQAVDPVGGLSNQEIDLGSITTSDPGQLLWLQMNQPLDLRLNARNATRMSAVRQLIMGGSISSLFLYTVDSAVTTLRVEVLGGGSLSVSEPSP